MIGHLQAEGHEGNDSGKLEIGLGQDECDVGRKDDDAVLHHLVTLELGDEEYAQYRRKISQQGSAAGHDEELGKRRTG